MNFIGRQPAEKLVAMVARKDNHSDDSTWYTDTGASHHVTSELGNLQVSTPYNGDDSFQIGIGESLPIHNTVFSTCFLGNKQLRLRQILHFNL